VTTTEELIEQVRDSQTVTVKYADRYARFRERFCPLDDGHATDRFLARFLPPPA